MSAPGLPAPPDLEDAPAFPRDADGPVFDEPWQARAFAVVVTLCQDGHYDWDEFRQRLIAEIGAAAGDATAGYYEHWLAACEKVLAERGMVGANDLANRKAELAVNPPAPTKAKPNPVHIDPGRPAR